MNVKPTLEERFWPKVNKDGPIPEHLPELGPCWLWTGWRSPKGYGGLDADGKQEGAHRVSWMLANGEIPPGVCVLHSCDNPPCVNPAHLRLGTKRENAEEMMQKGRHHTQLPGYVPRRGEATGRSAKLTAEQVREIRRRYERGESQPALARAFNVTSGQISRIVQRISWPHV